MGGFAVWGGFRGRSQKSDHYIFSIFIGPPLQKYYFTHWRDRQIGCIGAVCLFTDMNAFSSVCFIEVFFALHPTRHVGDFERSSVCSSRRSAPSRAGG